MKATKAINAHAHLNPGHSIEERIKHYDRPYIMRTFLFGNPDDVLKAQEIAPDRICAFPQLRLGETHLDDLKRCRDRGAKGFKFHMPRNRKAFDAPEFWPLYETIQEMKLPIVFHTGYSGYQAGEPQPDANIMGMHPFALDTICRNFQQLNIVGAHLGQPWCEDACLLTVKHPNLYFDLSGGTVRFKPASFWKRITATSAEPELRSLEEMLNLRIVGKWVFGTDNPSPDKYFVFYDNLTELLQVPAEICEDIYWRNAAKMLGMKPEDF